jgi:uncharacterized protein (DUF1778 family)
MMQGNSARTKRSRKGVGGRPPRGAKASVYRFQIRMEPAEVTVIQKAAAQCGQEHAGTWVRELALEAAAAVLRQSGKRAIVIT